MSVVDSLAYAVVQACTKDLLPVKQPIYRFEREEGKAGTRKVDTGETKDVRPREDHCEIFHFQQCWPSTALGFGGIGGQAFTNAYTTVVLGPLGDACVYFGGRLAYQIQKPNQRFLNDLASHQMKECLLAAQAYTEAA